jgi:nucleotide-binding universal stress UspA family protein
MLEEVMVSSVLVPLDGSPEAEQAIPYAQAVLPDNGNVLLFRVVPDTGALIAGDPDLTEWQLALRPGVEAAHAGELNAVRAELQELAARQDDSRVTWNVAAAFGDPAANILQLAEHQGVDLIVMTTHGRGAFGRALFGSVADRIVRNTSIPVMLIRPVQSAAAPKSTTIRRVLVPLDGSVLAEAAVPVASALAKRLGIPVHLIRVTNAAMTLATLSGAAPFPVTPPADIYDRMASDLDRSARTYLGEVAQRLRGEGVEVSLEVRDGSPYVEIPDAVQDGDVLVMTSHGRGGMLRWLLGSVAEKLVREAPAPVLLVPSPDRGKAHDGR